MAALEGHDETVENLVQARADVNMIDNVSRPYNLKKLFVASNPTPTSFYSKDLAIPIPNQQKKH